MPAIERPAMADYGVPTEPEGALDWSWGRERMAASRNYWVVTVSGSGEPFATPVWGVWLDDPEGFWFGCSPNAAKVRHLASNPQVTVMADSTVEVVSVHGIGTRVEAHQAAIDAMLPKYWAPDEFEASREFLMGNAMVHVRPTRAYAIIETEDDFSAKATRWVW